MKKPITSKEDRAAQKQARTDAKADKVAAKAAVTESIIVERAACVSSIRLPAEHQSWGATRIRAWSSLAAACAQAASRKKITPEALIEARMRLANVGDLSLIECGHAIYAS